MSYTIIQPPFTLKFKEMSRKDLKHYFEWFQSILPQRLDYLARAVTETPSFQDWEPDLTPTSLDLLGGWFAVQVETRTRTTGEIQEIESRSTYSIELSGEELTNRTFSLAMDVGMYLSKVFLTNHKSVRWDQPFGSKNLVDYGQPVLVGFGPAPFNPVQMVVTLAYGIANGKKSGKRLRELYDIWSGLVLMPPI